MSTELKERHSYEQELPPFVRTWRQFYRLLIAWLVLLILLFYAFTVYFK